MGPSLNECLPAGPPLQNRLLGVLTPCHFYPVLVAGDLRPAFLQVRIRESDRDALRFHWMVDKTAKEVETLRFTRVVFGLAVSSKWGDPATSSEFRDEITRNRQ